MIVSFGDGETEKIWAGERSRRLPNDIQSAALRKLRLINAARKVDDLRSPPGNRLERLHGDRAGQWSIRINDQWRVVFRWNEGGAEDVSIVDYH
jgi:proteic killer suppression protein